MTLYALTISITEVFMVHNLGKNIRRLRIERGITQEELADYIGVSYQAVSKWETDTTTPDISLLPRLAVFFGVRIDDILGITNTDELERVDFILEHEALTEENFVYAKKVLDKILENNPTDVRALKTCADLYLSRNQRDRLEARRMLRLAMESESYDAEIFGLYRQVCGGDSSQYRSATEDFIRGCEPYINDAADETMCKLMLDALITVRSLDRAEDLLIRYSSKLSASTANIFRGDIELAKGNAGKAVVLWSSVDEKDHRGQYEVGERFLRLCDFTRAEAAFKNSFAAAPPPRDLSAVYSLAFMYEKCGDCKRAAESWQLILDVLRADWNITDGESVDWAKREMEKCLLSMRE